MEETRTLFVGDNNSAPFLAFGDDSQYGDHLVFAFIILRRERLRRVERSLSDLKDRLRIPRDTKLHCRIMFNDIARQKAGLGHLSHEDARSILTRAIVIMNREKILLRYAKASLSRFKSAFGDEIKLEHKDGNDTIALPITAEPKALLGILANSCFSHQIGPNAAQCEVFVSQDSTKIGFVGPGRRRADSMYSGYTDIGAPNGSVLQLRPKVIGARVRRCCNSPISALTCAVMHMMRSQKETSSEINCGS
jgi:hypothetical protein